MSANGSGWKVFTGALVAGLLAASSATGQGNARTPITVSASEAAKGKVQVVGLQRRITLPDSRVLVLEPDGITVTLRQQKFPQVIREMKLASARINASVTLLASGRVLIWGGVDARNRVQPDGLWFDPNLKTLVPAERLPISGRAAHSATVLTDGRVLFAGGQPQGKPAELWNERNNRVETVSDHLSGNLLGHQAHLQSDGRVRLFGGKAAAPSTQSDVLFDPSNDRFVSDSTKPENLQDFAMAGSLPAKGAQMVQPSSRLSVRFTQSVRMTDLNTASVTLLGPGGFTAIDVVPVENGKLLFATPRQEMFPDSKYTLMINGVRSLSGKHLPLIAVDFKTAVLGVQDAVTDSTPESIQAPRIGTELVTGTGTSVDPCDKRAKHKLPCRATSELHKGVWTPGRDSTEGRWRVQGSQPDLIRTDIMGLITEAMGYTAVIGRIRRVDQTPVANVEVSLGGLRTRTNATGDFILYNPSAGKQELYVDGSTANGPGTEYGQFVVGIDVKAGKLTQLPYTMYLPRITARDKIKIPSPLARDVVLTHPEMPGLQVQIPAGTVIRDRKGRLVQELAIVPTPVNRAPFPVADNYPMYFTLEPGGAVIQGLTPEAAKGIRVFYPNYDGHPKGTQANFWIYDPIEGWQVYGKGRVTSDGTRFAPEAGVALHQTMGGSYSVSTSDPPTEPDKPPCSEACGSSGSGAGATAGDPIDLNTGEFFYSETDFAINDIVPISLARDYRPRDLKKREFGIATAANFNFKIYSPNASDYENLQVVLPGGMPVDFQRFSGSGYTGKWHQAGTSTAYLGATLEFMNRPLDKGYRLTLKNGSVMHFGNIAPNPLQWTQDRYGNRVEYVYDAGLVSRIIAPGGRYIDLEYDTENRIKTARNLLGNAWNYEYNSSGLLSKVIYPDSTFKQYNYKIYDVLGQPFKARLESVYDRKNQRVLYNEFEPIPLNQPGEDGSGWTGRVVKQTLADDSVINIQYGHVDGTTTATLVTNPDGSKRRVVFDPASHYPMTDTTAYGTTLAQTISFERNSSGQITARIDSLSRRTEYQYDGNGQILSITAMAGTPQSRTISLAYNAEGDIATITDPLNRTTHFGYSNRCLTSITNPLGHINRRTCNVAGQPTTISDPLNNVTTLTYDNADLIAVTDPLGRSMQFRYDLLGRLIAVEDAHGNVSRREYDTVGRVSASYDPSGNATQVAYDGNSNVTAVLLPHGNGITYTYDVRDRLEERTDSLGEDESWTYDAMNRVTGYTDRKSLVTGFQYDALGRGTVKTYPLDGGTITASYDAANRLISLADSLNGTLGWMYSSFDDVIQATSAQGNINYTYDAVGRRTSMVAASQALVEYQYDDSDRLTRILQGSEVVDFVYDNANRLTQMTLPNQVVSAYAYNMASELTGLAWSKADATVLGSLGYGYDDSGRQVAQTGTYAPQTLPAASTGANTFDDNQRQTAYNGQVLSYDLNGNLINDGTRTFVWNPRNQLTAIQQGSTTVASFTYDALGRRIGRNEVGSGTTYLYDGLNSVQEVRGTTVIPVLTGLGIDQRFARSEASGRTYLLTDMLGSTRALTNTTGNVVNRYDYDAYGTTTQTATTFTNPYQYTGREKDANGLYYYRARYYRPDMSRFISEDPIGLAGGPNPYAYVGGNPISLIDPLGLWGFGVLGGGSAEAGVGSLGVGITGSVGGGVFADGMSNAHLGGFAGGGFFSNGPTAGTTWSKPGRPSSYSDVGALGAFAGVGGGFFVTNATCIDQITGVGETSSLNIGVGPIKLSVQFTSAYINYEQIWLTAVTFGPGAGLSGSSYPTNTVATGPVRVE